MFSSVPVIRSIAARFRRSEDGGIAIIFALVMIPILGIAATAIDYGRASRIKTTLSRAGDAAVLEVATNLNRSDTAIEGEIRQHLDANLPKELQGIEFQMHVPSQRDFVEIEMKTSSKTTLAGVLGILELEIGVKSRANRIKHANNGKITPEMAKEMEKKLRFMLEQALQSGLGGGFGGHN